MITLSIGYDEADFNHRYEELKKYRVTLPPDPISLGFSGIAQLISEVQGYKDRVSELWNEALMMKSKAKLQTTATRYNYEAKLDLIIDTDPEITGMSSDRQRVARANKKLAKERADMNESELIYGLIDAYYKTVSNIHSNLESANRNLESQCNIYKRMNPPVDGQPQYHTAPQQYPKGTHVPTSL